MEEVLYLDNAATTFPKPEAVYRAMDKANRDYAVNAGRGAYALAAKAEDIISETREQLKRLAGADEVAEVVFTASATLACNQIFGGLDWGKIATVYVSPFEHNATARSLHHYQKQYGFCIQELAMKEDALELDTEKIRYQFLREKPDLVVLSHVSNVTGYILPIEEIALDAKKYQAIVVIDGAQALGVVPLSLRSCPADFYVFAGHKTLYGPFGTGGFLANGNCSLQPLLAGGTGSDSLNLEMPSEGTLAYEPGSPNIVSVAGLLASLKELEQVEGRKENPAYFLEKEQWLTEFMIRELEKIPGVTLYLPADLKRHAGIVSFDIEGYQAADVGMILDADYNIAVRTGYQCAPFIHKYLNDFESLGVVRASVGRFTTEEEIRKFVDAVREIAEG